ncbi:MAG: penicillin-binding protein activator LpoB [Alphaproteobacteria bacterium]|nr:penicillin-binding protein activator LpoB [Alphaproteobacteria bacterium]
MKKFLLLALFCLVGCAGGVHEYEEQTLISSNTSTKWELKDTQNIVSDLINKMNLDQKLQAKLNEYEKTPNLFIANIKNNTGNPYFPISDINAEILEKLSKTNSFILIDSQSRLDLMKELKYQYNGLVSKDSQKKVGKQSSADILLFGDIRSYVNSNNKKDYTFNIWLTDLEKGTELVRYRFKVSK